MLLPEVTVAGYDGALSWWAFSNVVDPRPPDSIVITAGMAHFRMSADMQLVQKRKSAHYNLAYLSTRFKRRQKLCRYCSKNKS